MLTDTDTLSAYVSQLTDTPDPGLRICIGIHIRIWIQHLQKVVDPSLDPEVQKPTLKKFKYCLNVVGTVSL
jgi:hypothetical protein